MRITESRCVFKISILCMLISGIIYAQWGQLYERIFFAISVLLTCLSIRTILVYRIQRFYISDFFFSLTIIFFYIDSFVFLRLKPLVYGSGLLICYIILRKLFADNYNLKLLEINYRIIIAVSLLIYFIGVAKSGVYYPMYASTFENPNTLGIFSATTAIVIISRLIQKLNEMEQIKPLEVATLIISIIFAFLSWSRIAILAVLSALCFLMFVMIAGRKIGHVQKKKVVIFLMGITAFILNGRIFYDVFIKKFIFLSEQGDISNGRIGLWISAWLNSGILGNGDKAVKGLEVHNVYFGLVNQYGKTVGFFFFCFVITAFIESLIFLKSGYEDKWKYLPVLSTGLFACVSMTENYLMTYPMLLMFISMSIMRRYDMEKNLSRRLTAGVS